MNFKIGDEVTVTGPKWSKFKNKGGEVVSIQGEFVGVDFPNARDIHYIFKSDLRLGRPLLSMPVQEPLKK